MNSFVLGLLLIFGMSIVSNAFVPVPITMTTVWMGQFQHPYWVILAATAGSVVGWLLFYRSLHDIVEKKPGLVARIPQSYFDWFGRGTPFWLFLFNALPIPIDFVRLIAVIKRKPLLSLTWAIALGRLVRNSMLVFLGVWLSKHQPIFWGMIAFLVIMPLVPTAIKWLRQRMLPQAPELS